MNTKLIAIGALALAAAACAPKRIHETPIMVNGDRVASSQAVVAQAGASAAGERAAIAARRDALAAEAIANCAPAVCEAVARGEVMLGMTTAQVMAATRTTEQAWTVRDAGSATVLVPRSIGEGPRDAVGNIALVQLSNGQVTSYGYRESQGTRVVSNPGDATTAGRARALAEALVREGDEFVARGDMDAALDRYDRASVLSPTDPALEFRIATILDKSLRPVEALMRYKQFLHQMELERIEVTGEAYAKMTAAMVHARERIIVLEKNER